MFTKSTVYYSRLSKRGRIFEFWDILFGKLKTITLCIKNITKMNGIFVWFDIVSPNFYRLWVWLMYTFWYVNMLNVTAGYGRLLQHVWNVVASSNFYKLCVKVEVYRWK